MKILFSPSESKTKKAIFPPINKNYFIFLDLYSQREFVINKYKDFVLNADIKKLCRLLGLKKEKECEKYRKDIFREKTLKAVQRYNGVAYDYLDYNNLDIESINYIDKNTIIFSNLFGPILAGSKIPFYKLKQGEKIGDFSVESYYRKNFSEKLERFLENEDILDLRANYYEKFFSLKKRYTKLKFVKNSKIVSYWAKAYRGIVLREIAKNKIDNIEDFFKMEIEGLKVMEIKKTKKFDEIVYPKSRNRKIKS